MNTDDRITKSLLNFDPVAVAEAIVPRHEEGADMLMLAMAFSHGARKKEHLQSIGDSHWSMPFNDMITMILKEGFVEIYKKDFIDNQYPDDEDGERTESHFVFFNANDGILITLESYHNAVNNAKMYYNIELNDDADRSCTSSGGYVGKNAQGGYNTFSGGHDIREGFRYHLNRLRANGKFLAKWVERPFLWLLTYMETKSGYGKYDYEDINESVIIQFPQNVIDAITP